MLTRLVAILLALLCVTAPLFAQPASRPAPSLRHTLGMQVSPQYVTDYNAQLSELAYSGFMMSYAVRYRHRFSARFTGEGVLDFANGTLGQSPIQLGQALRVQPTRSRILVGVGYRIAYRIREATGSNRAQLYGGLWTRFRAAFIQHQYATGVQSDVARYTSLIGLSTTLRYAFSPVVSASADVCVPVVSFVGQSQFASTAWERFGFDGTLLSPDLSGAETALSVRFTPSSFGFESRYAVQYMRFGAPVNVERLTHTFSLAFLYTL
jgi:hypothetical protein